VYTQEIIISDEIKRRGRKNKSAKC
jgi:hypothetical protein